MTLALHACVSTLFVSLQELLAYIGLYFVINLIYREVLVKNSECEQCLKVGICSSLQGGPSQEQRV
jgi:hypothetical protein